MAASHEDSRLDDRPQIALLGIMQELYDDMLAASNLLAKDYGYAAEGHMPCTSLVAVGLCFSF